ncbi:MAG: flagellar hook-basal body complex protein [Phycisphaeraceae bacterium]
MGLTSSLYTGLSGLNANSQLINLTGNNIANSNTTGFKASRMGFDTQISQQLSSGSAPSAESGGTNPSQIGLGVRVGAVVRDFRTGNLQPTGTNTDVAIEGNGFFVVKLGDQQRYTRAGSFQIDKDFDLVDSHGAQVQGYGIDSNFTIVPGVLQSLNIPIGVLTLAEATRTVRLGGNLNAGGDVATQGAVIASSEVHSVAGSGAGANQATAATALTSLFDTGSATAMFTTGDVIRVSGATRGGASVPDHTFHVGAVNTSGSDDNGTTVNDFLTFLQDIMGINPALGGAGVTVNAGQITITGNSGSVNDLSLLNANIVLNPSAAATQPFNFTKSQEADGESVRTTFNAFDSLGNPLTINLSLVLEDKTTTGTQWRFYADSEDDSRLQTALGNGTLSFDTNGQIANVMNSEVTIQRTGSGAASPQIIDLQFNHGLNTISALTDITSQVAALQQDGSPVGTLQDFTVSNDGRIVGVFSNSLLRDLGQIVLATFTNPQGLVEEGNNLYAENVNSGSPQIYAPGAGGAGRVVGGALEQSNVDLSQEFINLIAASTGFSASSRVLTTSDRLIQELIRAVQ